MGWSDKDSFEVTFEWRSTQPVDGSHVPRGRIFKEDSVCIEDVIKASRTPLKLDCTK